MSPVVDFGERTFIGDFDTYLRADFEERDFLGDFNAGVFVDLQEYVTLR